MSAEILAREQPAAADPIHELIRLGDHRGAIGLCARYHGASIGRLCMAWLGSQAEAEEAAQETMLAALDAMAAYRAEGTVRSWLFGIARRVCARRAETHTRREARLRLVRDEQPEAPGADALVSLRRSTERVRAALATLKPSERDVVVLRYEADMTFREVAEACGIEEATARKRASRALERLRTALSEE